MYQKMYYTLFHAMTDALQAMEAQEYETAREIMKQAQLRAEEIYINQEE